MRLGKLSFDRPAFLAPMAGVTDLPFRLLCRMEGCDLTYTEMVSAKGLLYGGLNTKRLLELGDAERPVGVQLFGREPEVLASMAGKLADAHGDALALIDLNMGCPAPKITGNGEGSALMLEPLLAGRIIAAVRRAVEPLPVTVKFRKGWDDAHVNAVAFARIAEENGAAAVAVHGRTRAEGYSGKADWAIIAAVKQAIAIPVLGNGDVFSGTDALRMYEETGCDGVLVARGAEGNPWIFSEIRAALAGEAYAPPSPEARAAMAAAHAKLQQAYRGEHGVLEMRKHLGWYLKGAPGAAKLRARANAAKSLAEIEALLEEYLRGSASAP